MNMDKKEFKRIVLSFLKMLRETIYGKDDNILCENTMNRSDD